MKQTVLMVLLMATPAAPALGEPGAAPASASPSKESAMASQDPLMRQILHRQLTQRNGGITAAVRIASGESIEVQLPDADAKPAEELKDALNSEAPADPLTGLKPTSGLAAGPERPAAFGGSKAAKPTAQLKTIEKSRKDWGDAANGGIVSLDAETETDQDD